MINRINFLGQVQANTDLQARKHTKVESEPDSFSISPEGKKDQSIRKAKERIIEELKKTGNEYGFTISENGEILEETQGNEKSCTVDSRKITPNAILLHGHPIATPLSSGDIAILLATDAKSQEAITQDGRFSRLTKKAPIKLSEGYAKLYHIFEKELCLMALDKLGVDYTLNNEDVAQMGRDYVYSQTGKDMSDMTVEEVFKELNKYGIQTDCSSQEIFDQLKEYMFMQFLTEPQKYDKEHNAIMENKQRIEEFLDSEEGTKTRHQLVERLAERYNMDYETNL